MLKYLPFLMLGVGVFLLVQIIMPVLSYKFWEISLKTQNLSLATTDPSQQQVLGVSIENTNNFPAFVSNIKREFPPLYKDFKVTIPSIGLEGVETAVDSNEFEDHLAHLPGSALPGEKGNMFITGHSSFPQFFKPGNFKAIFANLPGIKPNSKILVEAGGQKFEYIVLKLHIVDPSEVSVLNPPDETGRYLTLMTCVPPGFYSKRLIVLAKLK